MSIRRLVTLASGAWPSLVLILLALRLSLAPQAPSAVELAAWFSVTWFPVALLLATRLGRRAGASQIPRLETAPVVIRPHDRRLP